MVRHRTSKVAMGKSEIAIKTDSGESHHANAAACVADPRAALAAQFIPGGAASVRRYLPTGCSIEARTLDTFADAASTGPDIVVRANVTRVRERIGAILRKTAVAAAA
jgi:hypothetical protein